jgi:hypothetical protein
MPQLQAIQFLSPPPFRRRGPPQAGGGGTPLNHPGASRHPSSSEEGTKGYQEQRCNS